MTETNLNVWVSANPSFQRFDSRLIRQLMQYVPVARWEYYQGIDEPSCLEIPLNLLTEYLSSLAEPVNLIGHSTGGVIALLYAQKYAKKVKSLTLLSVGVYPAVDWQIHYYTLRGLLPCSQEIILAQMVQKMFGHQNPHNTKGLVEILRQDLNTSPSPHSLFKKITITPQAIKMPLMICGAKNDTIVDPNALRGWQSYLKTEDVIWEFPQGNHFFHYFCPEKVSRKILNFWHITDNDDKNALTEQVKDEVVKVSKTN